MRSPDKLNEFIAKRFHFFLAGIWGNCVEVIALNAHLTLEGVRRFRRSIDVEIVVIKVGVRRQRAAEASANSIFMVALAAGIGLLSSSFG